MLLDHPKHGRFSAREFVGELERNSITVGTNYLTRFFGDGVQLGGVRAWLHIQSYASPTVILTKASNEWRG